MALEKPRHSVVGRPAFTELPAHPVAIPNTMAGLSEGLQSLQNVSSGVVRLGAQAVTLQQQEERLRASEALQLYQETVDKRMAEEVYSLKGNDTASAAEAANRIHQEAFEEISGQVPYPMRDHFSKGINLVRLRSDANVTRFRQSAMNAAESAAASVEMDYATKAFRENPNDTTALDQLKGAYDRQWKINFGAVPDVDSLDADTENGTIKTARGTLRVVSEKTGAAGEITSSEVAAIRKRMSDQRSAYDKGLQVRIDSMHALAITDYIKSNRYEEAYNILDRAKEGPFPMSKAAADRTELELDRSMKVFSVETTAGDTVDTMVSVLGRQDPASANGLYWTPMIERASQEALAKADREANTADPDGSKGHYAAELRRRVNLARESMVRRENAMADQIQTDFQKRGFFSLQGLAPMQAAVASLPEGQLRDRVMQDVAKFSAKITTEFSKDPETVSKFKSAANEFKRKVAMGATFTEGGNNYRVNTSNPEEIKAVAMRRGLPEKYATEVAEYFKNPPLKGDLAYRAISEALNVGIDEDPISGRFSPQAVTRLCPEMVDQLEAVVRMGPDEKWDKDRLRQTAMWLLASKARTYKTWLGNLREGTLPQYLKRVVDAKGTIINREGVAEADYTTFVNELGMTDEQRREEGNFMKTMKAMALRAPIEPSADVENEKSPAVRDDKDGVWRTPESLAALNKKREKVEKDMEPSPEQKKLDWLRDPIIRGF